MEKPFEGVLIMDQDEHEEFEKRTHAVAKLLEAARFAAWAFGEDVELKVGEHLATIPPSAFGQEDEEDPPAELVEDLA